MVFKICPQKRDWIFSKPRPGELEQVHCSFVQSLYKLLIVLEETATIN